MSTVRVGLIGDYNGDVVAHEAVPRALELAGHATGYRVEPVWVGTESLDDDAAARLDGLDALWCVPASPYASMEGALAAIRCAREQDRPFLGTCAGFQHALIEYARNVLGLADADHAETDPGGDTLVVSQLACALVEARGGIALEEGSRIRKLYGSAEIEETYRCRYGLNPRFRAVLEQRGLVFTGFDADGEPRVLELTPHPFFIATLFQPERSALTGEAHPLITGFVEQAAADLSSKPAGHRAAS